MKLNTRQQEALLHLAEAADRPCQFGGWCDVECGVDGRTGMALVRRGLAETKRRKLATPVQRFTQGWAEWERVNTYPVFRITNDGAQAAREMTR